jgi:molybdate transport system substrate-binding protein
MRLYCTFLIFLLTISIPISSYARIVLASGAGYRSIVDDLADAYTAESGDQIERIYGNMSRIIAQSRTSGAVDMVLGDASFLENAHLAFTSSHVIGQGKLVAVFPKGGSFQGAPHLLSPRIRRIAIPDTSRAIYGKAAVEYLQKSGLYDLLKSKLIIVSTVPQAASYVVANEVDCALINLTHARKIQNSIGGYSIIDETMYSPISIIIGQLESSLQPDNCEEFVRFLKTEKARKITAAHGM